jgi:hypothetical protein
MNRSSRKSAAQWAELVTQFSNGTESERDFCLRQGIKLVTLRKWRYHYQASRKIGSKKMPAGFVKVNLTEPRVVASHSAAVLWIGADMRLECPTSYDVAALAELALAVHHGR